MHPLPTPTKTRDRRPPVSLTFHWFLPTNGDSRHVVGGGHGTPATASGRDRPPTVAYLSQIAKAAEDLGFVGALTPTGAWCEDAWLTTAMVSRHTERLKFLVAFRPGFVSPTLAAQMAATFQRHSGGRLLLNVVTGGESHEQRAYGDFLDKDDRYRRTGEFLEIVRKLWDGKTVDLHGEHLRVEDARLARVPDPVPEIYFGGSSPIAGEVAARHVDVYLTWFRTFSRRSPRRSPGCGSWPPNRAAPSASASGCTSSPATPRGRPGPRPTGSWRASTPRP
ncbi:alkanesulfonate monooxygenase [Streptomyces sp. e14]|nr:alkanesulfonate monooxygenase [Streptomyces sp. e14]